MRDFNCDTQSNVAWKKRATVALQLWLRNRRLPLGGEYRVADFGCGNEKLRGLLEKEISLQGHLYLGYDITPQSKRVHKLNLMLEMPPGPFDVVFCLGLLEYLPSVSDFFRRLSSVGHHVVFSYVVADSGAYTKDQIFEKGWAHHLRMSDIEELLKRESWKTSECVSMDHGKTLLWYAEYNG